MSSISNSAVKFSSLGLRAKLPTIARLMSAALENPSLLSLAAGFTDNGSLPLSCVNAAVEKIAQKDLKETLQYGSNQGRPRLRELLSEHLNQWEPELAVTPDSNSFFVTNGSQQAIYLAMQVLCEPGDIVLVDRPSYFVFLEMLKAMGVRAVSLPVDENGFIDGAGLAALLNRFQATGDSVRIKAVYVVSYYSNPSSRCLNSEEKSALATVLLANDLIVPVIEDAAYRDLYFSEKPETKSMLGMKVWDDFPKLYLSTLTKPFATGLKVGYGFCTDSDWLARMLHTKGHHDFGSANFCQAILERVIADGRFERQLSVIRPMYGRKMCVLHETLLHEGLEELGWSWSKPEGGLYLWLKGPEAIDTSLESKFCRSCIAAGVLYVPGGLCFDDDGPSNYVRLSYGVLNEAELGEAGRRFVRVAREFVS